MIYDGGKYRKQTAADEKAWAKIPAPEGHEIVYGILFEEDEIKAEEAKQLKKLIDEKISEKDWRGG